MGILKALAVSVVGTLRDQWLEHFVCDAIPQSLLMVRARKLESPGTTNRGDSNVISEGSTFIVTEGEAALMVNNGKLTGVCVEPGQYRYESSGNASIFSGGKLKSIFSEIWVRFTFGGDVPHAPNYLYYVNLKEITGIPFQASGIPFRITDSNTELDLDASLNCSGIFSFRIADPASAYRFLFGNASEEVATSEVSGHLTTDVTSSLADTLSAYATEGMRLSLLPSMIPMLERRLAETVTDRTLDRFGIEILNVAFSSITVCSSDGEIVKSLQRADALSDPLLAAGYISAGWVDAANKAANDI